MQEIVTPSGSRAIRKNGVLYQHLDLDNPRTLRSFTSGRWYQDVGDDTKEDMPPLRPVQINSRPKGMFFDGPKGPVLVAAGDFVARDADGQLSLLPAERVRNHVVLPVPASAPREKIEDAARSTLERTSRVREVARSRAGDREPSPISVREDDEGRAMLVSTLPDGREKIWKTFAWKKAAETFLADDEKHAGLLKSHKTACERMRSVNDMAHAFRMDRRAGQDR